jgi:hypothetical protein
LMVGRQIIDIMTKKTGNCSKQQYLWEVVSEYLLFQTIHIF